MKFHEVKNTIEAIEHLRKAREALSSVGGDWVEVEMQNIDMVIANATSEVKRAIGDLPS